MYLYSSPYTLAENIMVSISFPFLIPCSPPSVDRIWGIWGIVLEYTQSHILSTSGGLY